MKERNSYGKIMKRNWILAIGIISALSITACGGNQAGQKESSAQTAGYESEAQDAGSQGGDGGKFLYLSDGRCRTAGE